MVLNTHNSFSTTAISDEDDAWEMVGDESNNNENTTPLVDTTQENRSNQAPAAAAVTAAVPNVNETAAPGGSILERTMERQSSHHIGTIDLAGSSPKTNQNNESTTNQGVDGNASIASGMSSITGDHHTVSDGDEDEEVAAKGGEEEVAANDSAAKTDDLLLEEDKVEDEQDAAPPAATTKTPRAPEETIEFEEAASETSSDPLVESLSQMGFKKEQIERAIGDLRVSGQEVDADSVIGSMAGEIPPTPPEAGEDGGEHRPRNPFHTTWDFVESTAQNIDDQHQLRRRTRDLGENIGRSARDLWSNVREESERIKSNVRETCDQADVHARTATTQLRHSASTVGETIRRANEEHRIAQKVATVAVVGGATLLAIGNPRAGVATLAVAGASFAAGEALRNSSSSRDRPGRRQQSGEDSPYSPSYNGDHGLREGLHLD